MSTVPAAGFDSQSDAELITSVRAGTLAAYGTLYERHVGAAYNLARRLASNVESDDLVSEAFAKVLDILRNGKGPDSAFRAYLLATLRHTAYAKRRKDRWVYLNDDMTTVSRAGGAAAEALTVQFSDTAIAGLERTLVAKAFSRLPERWQAVLWHTEIEQQPPSDVALVLGLTPNGVSALAHRAREGLRQAYLQVHLARTPADRCRATAERLGAWTRQGLAKRERAQVEAHLDECARCRALAAELADVNGALRAVVAPIVLGNAAFGYLTTTGAKVDAGSTGTDPAPTGRATGSRQVVAVAVAGAVITAAVAAAIAMSGSSQTIPPSAAGPQPAQLQPAQPLPLPGQELPLPAIPPGFPLPLPPMGGGPVPPAGADHWPELPQPGAPPPQVAPSLPHLTQQPSPPSASSPGAPPPSSPSPGTQPPPSSSTVQPAEGPHLTVQPPPSGVELLAGGGSAELPITVLNDGKGASEPVTAALQLPDGVHTVSYGPEFTAPEGDTLPPVDCYCSDSPGDSVNCWTDQGLRPGQTTIIDLRLAADPDARSGVVTGTISTQDGTQIPVNVPIVVDTAPNAPALGVNVEPSSPSPQLIWLDVEVRNNGPASGPVNVVIDRPARLDPGAAPVACAGSDRQTSCTANDPLSPDGQLRLRFRLDAPPDGTPVKVTATLGSATEARTISPPARSASTRVRPS